MRVAQCTLFSLVLASTNALADWAYNLTPGVTPISRDIYALHMIIFWICVVIGVLVFGVMFYAIIHHRKSRGAKPAHFHEHLGVELAWTLIPFVILVIMAIPATSVLSHIRNTEKPDLTIEITGYQWKWRYRYLSQDIHFFSNNNTPYDQIYQNTPKNPLYLKTVDHPLVLPIHKKIRFLITSNDVVHAWWVQALGIKQDAIPGFIIESWATINRAGTYYGECAELCGMNHAYMPIVVIAMGEKDFANWITQQKTGAPPPTVKPSEPAKPITQTKAVTEQKTSAPLSLTAEVQKGQQIYSTTCAVCHQINGEGIPPVYPALKNSKITTGDLAQHINLVLFGKAGTAMQAFKDQLTNDEIAAVVTYERNSWGNNKGDAADSAMVNAAKLKGQLPE